LLDRNRPQPGEEDLRGWEWRYLWQLTRSSALVTLTNRPTRGSAVSFSPDGTRLAVGWHGGRVDVWDVPGRRWVRALSDRDTPHHQQRAVFSPVGNLLAAAPNLEEVVLYDLDSGRESILLRMPDKKELWDIRDLSFSMDGSRVVIYAGAVEKFGDAVWVVNVSSSRIEGRYSTAWSNSELHGAARLSPDNRRLYLARSDAANYRYGIQCLDLTTGKQLWQTDPERDYGLTTLDISPDGQVLASGSGFEDSTIRVWEAATGKLLHRLDGHTGWVCKLAFTRDGRRLISAASDQSIRFWDTSTWTEIKVLRGHTDEVYAVAISEPAQLAASAGKDGNLMLWKEDGRSAANGYHRLPEKLRVNEVLPLDHSRVLLLPPGKRPELVDLERDSTSVSLPEIGSSTNVLVPFGTNILCHWNGTNQILVHEWRGTGFIEQGAISLDSGTRPTEFAYHPTRRLLAWTQATSSTSVYLASLAAPGRQIELKSDVGSLVLFRFSEDGNYLAATAEHDHSLRAWNVETGRNVASINERVRAVIFAAGGRVLVAAIEQGNDHEIGFYDLDHPGQAPRRVSGKGYATSLAVSPDGGLVASATAAGQVRLFDPFKGELIESVHAHLNGASCVAFSPNGRRLISTSGGREAIKLWDVGNRQELLTLGGTGSLLEAARWSAGGDVILAGPPWQAWRAPSWEEIAAAEAEDKAKIQR
jgi:WD40 repeat protein